MSDDTPRINGVEVSRSIPLRGLQKTVAERMAESRRTTAHVTAMAEADAGPIFEALHRLRDRIPGLSPTHLLVKATATCLRRHPRLNATLQGETIHELSEVNVSVALSLPSDDLQLAVIRRADEKSLEEISSELSELRRRAEEGMSKISDVRGGTFTLSNYGTLRSVVWATPIITPGQVGVLGVARAASRIVGDGTEWSVRTVLPLSLAYDHRIVNGVPAGRFLDDLVETISTAELFRQEDRA